MTRTFEIEKTCPGTAARAGFITTAHGVVPTPAFMPVGSQATVKALTPDDLQDLGAAMVLANAYHLYLRPGDDVISRMGGLHRFMAWDGPLQIGRACVGKECLRLCRSRWWPDH